MKNITLRQIRYVDAVARLGHFGNAAEDCAVSQPALSMQIRDLEAELGQPLFDRTARRVQLTAFGEVFVARLRDILRQVDELGDIARAARGTLTGRLRIGVIPTVAPYLLPAILPPLMRELPGLELNLREAVTPKLIQELNDGVIDTAIVALPVSEPNMVEVPLFSEEFVLVRPPGYENAPIPDPRRLGEMRLLLLEEGHCFREQALSYCARKPGAARELLDASSLATLVQMVGAGIGVTLIPQMAVPVETRSAEVAIARFPQPGPRRTLGMIWRRNSPLAAQMQQVCDIVQTAAEATQLSSSDAQ